MPTAPRRSSLFLRHLLPLGLIAVALAGCLQRVAIPESAPANLPVATVPAGFFAATPPAPTVAPDEPFSGRYTLVATEALPASDERARYAAPLRGRSTRYLQISLLITELREPRTPAFAYELVTDLGVFGALASGEWEAASPTGATYRQEGVLLFVVPQSLREARLEIVDYAYPRSSGGVAQVLQREVIASFALPALP